MTEDRKTFVKGKGIFYPIPEVVDFKYCCPGCGKLYKTTIPKHDAPFRKACDSHECGWVLIVQTDVAGISAGFSAPFRPKTKLRLL